MIVDQAIDVVLVYNIHVNGRSYDEYLNCEILLVRRQTDRQILNRRFAKHVSLVLIFFYFHTFGATNTHQGQLSLYDRILDLRIFRFLSS